MRKSRLQRALFILIIILMVISLILIYPFTVAPKGATVNIARFSSDMGKYKWQERFIGGYPDLTGQIYENGDSDIFFSFNPVFYSGPRHYGEINMMVRTFLYVRYREVSFNLTGVGISYAKGMQGPGGWAELFLSTEEFNLLYDRYIVNGMREREKIEILSEAIILKTGYERRQGRRAEVR